MTNKVELLPCPHCGGPAIMMDEPGGAQAWWAMCADCKASTTMASSGAKAAEHWNRRAPVVRVSDIPSEDISKCLDRMSVSSATIANMRTKVRLWLVAVDILRAKG